MQYGKAGFNRSNIWRMVCTILCREWQVPLQMLLWGRKRHTKVFIDTWGINILWTYKAKEGFNRSNIWRANST